MGRERARRGEGSAVAVAGEVVATVAASEVASGVEPLLLPDGDSVVLAARDTGADEVRAAALGEGEA